MPEALTMTRKPAESVESRREAAVGTDDELPMVPGSAPPTIYESRRPPQQTNCEEMLTAHTDFPPQATRAYADEV